MDREKIKEDIRYYSALAYSYEALMPRFRCWNIAGMALKAMDSPNQCGVYATLAAHEANIITRAASYSEVLRARAMALTKILEGEKGA